eukprot:1149422-Pelagomonas_calceolata.AAC.9
MHNHTLDHSHVHPPPHTSLPVCGCTGPLGHPGVLQDGTPGPPGGPDRPTARRSLGPAPPAHPSRPALASPKAARPCTQRKCTQPAAAAGSDSRSSAALHRACGTDRQAM